MTSQSAHTIRNPPGAAESNDARISSPGADQDGRSAAHWAVRILRRPAAGALAGTVFVFLFFTIFAGGNGFDSVNGTATWLDQAAELGVVAVPVGLLMIAGEFDLSIASVIGLGALTVSIGTGSDGLPLLVSVGIALAVAALIGLCNGIVTVRTGVPSFIVTLASFFAVGGVTLALTESLTTTTNVALSTSGPLHAVFAGSVHQFNASIAWCALIALLAGYVLSRTVFGNWIFATGGDKAAAREAGVPTDPVKVSLFVTSSLGAALLGIIQAVEYNGGQVGQGNNFIFDAIVASVIGGVLLQGGYGSATGIVLGAMTYGIVNAGIYYTGWNSDLAQVFVGVLVLAAVLANNSLRKLATRA
jgi:simple sugar transport system permease protein